VLSYGVQTGHPRQAILNSLTIASAVAVVGIVFWSACSDRFGRRPIVLAGAVLMAGYAFVLFPMVAAGSLTFALVLGLGVLQPMVYGPLAALYTELFTTESRYTGASLGYQIAGLGAGFGPLLFAEILRVSGGTVTISVVIAAFCAITVACVLALSETSRRELTPGDVAGSLNA
jgi:MFS family permease